MTAGDDSKAEEPLTTFNIKSDGCDISFESERLTFTVRIPLSDIASQIYPSNMSCSCGSLKFKQAGRSIHLLTYAMLR